VSLTQESRHFLWSFFRGIETYSIIIFKYHNFEIQLYWN